tara:strand:+ start:264 stop:503 length:240 start_codon:yes stop_codon:yes gene_type:complete
MKKKRIIREAVRGKATNPKTASLMVVYMLSKALSISPLEIYKMPITLVKDLLMLHTSVEEIKSDEIDKIQKKAESAKYG